MFLNHERICNHVCLLSVCFRVQDIFDIIFEVEDGVSGDDRGRLILTLEYERNLQKQESYGPIENKVVARVDIQQDNTHAIVPVIKVVYPDILT